MAGNTMDPLDALSTLDGRYRTKVEKLSQFLSEKALIQTRLEVEIQYLFALSKTGVIRAITQKEKKILEDIANRFSHADAVKIKHIEEVTRHDVKAVEYFLKEKLSKTSLADISKKTHVFLTSEDVNNISQRVNFQKALEKEIIPLVKSLTLSLVSKAQEYKAVPMMARTHGQNAVPTTVGKELIVFASRFNRELQKLKSLKFTGKLSGAVGNYNAFKIVDEKKQYKIWADFSSEFVSYFGLASSPVTTQINTYEDIIEALQVLQRINGIGIDFASDMWRYISDGWYGLKTVKSEVGSSTMPQKVNPIDFENGEGNLSLSNDLISGLVSRLPVSRLQRDLRDSTQIRNIGLVLGFITLGFKSIEKGFARLSVNSQIIEEVLLSDWSILSEGAQVWLKIHEDADDPYQMFKAMTRGHKMNQKEWEKEVLKLDVSDKARQAFLKMSPRDYIGYAVEIVEFEAARIKKSA